jgi:hypothetical protein
MSLKNPRTEEKSSPNAPLAGSKKGKTETANALIKLA